MRVGSTLATWLADAGVVEVVAALVVGDPAAEVGADAACVLVGRWLGDVRPWPNPGRDGPVDVGVGPSDSDSDRDSDVDGVGRADAGGVSDVGMSDDEGTPDGCAVRVRDAEGHGVR